MADRIVIDPEILAGKPVIKGTRISVEFILELLSSGMTIDEVLKEYPHLKREDILAARRSLHSTMRLEVPFFKQTSQLNCGPTALRMIFSFFGCDYPVSLIEEKVCARQGKGVSTIRLAIAAAELGFTVSFYSKSLYFNPLHLQKPWYKQFGDLDVDESKQLVEEARQKGVQLFEKTVSLQELLQKITSNAIPVLILDWNIVKGRPERSYQGHFVPIVGYDENSVYVHNQGFENPTSFLKIPCDVFDKARKSDGTDEDVLIISKK